MRKLSLGDTVTATLFSGRQVIGKVEEIQITRYGFKSGRVVENCDLDKHKNGVLDLDCGHWCYFYQVESINKN